MRWTDLLSQFKSLQAHDAPVDIRGVQYDSRRLAASEVFIAMRGGSADGNRFIDAALRKGAAAVVTDSPETYDELRRKQPELALALVGSGRRALAEISRAVFGRPQDKLKLSAVTGTNGKTTTAFLLEQMLRSVSRKSVLIGTIETHVGDEIRASEHTTPESRDILALFADGVRAGCTEAVMEMSSHALEQERVWGLPVDVAIFTNLTQDHLDYHGTMSKYASAKAKLFAGVGAVPPRIAVVNADDPLGSYMANHAQSSGCALVWSYGIAKEHTKGKAFQAFDIKHGAFGTAFRWDTEFGTVHIRSPLAGRINVYNLLAAGCAALARGLTLEQISEAAVHLQQVPGRFQVVSGSRKAGFSVVVDYAHTDDALRNLIALARDQVGEHGGRVITLFGCGGDRDRTKRPRMGRAAGEDSDLVVVTSDNPRNEEPMAIINEALLGVRETKTTYVVEEDRGAAINVAIRAALPGDIVLLAGKGHEKTQVFADGAVPFDDVAEAERVLHALEQEVRV